MRKLGSSIACRLRFALNIACLTALLSGCSSAPREAEGVPEWTKLPARTVENGYIIYVASGSDKDSARAAFKAEGQALEDLANECSFAPKGARVEDRYTENLGVLYKGYSKVGIEFRDCEQAKSAVLPDDIRKLANASMADEIKKFRDLTEGPQIAQADEDDEDEPEEGAAPTSAPNQTRVYIRDTPQFFVVRDQVAVYKQQIILAPPTAYAPNSPETVTYMNRVGPRVQNIQSYENANPSIARSATTWTAVKRERMNSQPQGQASPAGRVRHERNANRSKSRPKKPRKRRGNHERR